VDPTIFFFFDDFSLKIFHLNKHGKSKDFSKQLIQIIPLRMVSNFSRLFFQTVNGNTCALEIYGMEFLDTI
jgi:hypothetical protein